MSLYIGIDLGTSAVKLLLMDELGQIKQVVSKEYPLEFPQPGWSQQRAEDWRKAVLEGIPELLKGFDTKLLAYDPFIPQETIQACGAEPVTMEQLLQRSDVVSLHMPSTPDTYHLINAETLAMMKDGAYLVNTARGALVDEKALYEALTSGKLSGAALDVFEKEPITKDNPLFTLDNAVFAPHVSALSFETNYNGSIICAESIIRVYRGENPVYPV